jgi:hypothetical protein
MGFFEFGNLLDQFHALDKEIEYFFIDGVHLVSQLSKLHNNLHCVKIVGIEPGRCDAKRMVSIGAGLAAEPAALQPKQVCAETVCFCPVVVQDREKHDFIIAYYPDFVSLFW